MSLFSLSDVKTHPNRNGFDLGFRNLFSAQAGQLLPVMCKEVYPSDKFKMSVSSLTRTQQLNTAAFCRFTEYYDFFFVPTRLLWRFFPDFVVQNEITDTTTNDSKCPTALPLFDLSILHSLMKSDGTRKDEFGFLYREGGYKLLDLLGYGSYKEAPVNEDYPMYCNPFSIACYQKIYQDFYRNTSWEKYNPRSFNLDKYDSVSSSPLANQIDAEGVYDLLQIRYANYKKDYFLGVRPTTQFGDVSMTRVIVDKTLADRVSMASPNIAYKNEKGELDTVLQGQFDILSLRKAEALQRWKEVTMANDSRYNAQIKAHFGFDVPDSRAQLSEFIGGTSNTIQISEVVSTDSVALGKIGGKGIGSENSKTFDYDVKEHGYIMCIYHVKPSLDYSAYGIKRQHHKFESFDFYQPEFQNIGLDSVRVSELCYGLEHVHILDVATANLGYAPRYLDLKTSYDEVHGEFRQHGSMNAWTISNRNVLRNGYGNRNEINYLFFKVSPQDCDSVFLVNADGSSQTDQFLVNSYFDINAVRSMSVDGMPY